MKISRRQVVLSCLIFFDLIIAAILSIFIDEDLETLFTLSSLILVLIFYFLIFVSRKKKEKILKERIGLNQKERAILEKDIKDNFLIENKKFVKKFIIVWTIFSVIISFVFVNVLADWRTTGWETVGTFAVFFTVMGFILIKIMNKSNTDNKFPNVRELFQKHKLSSIEVRENYLDYREIEPVDEKYTIVQGRFSGKLQNNSDIEYDLRIQEMRHRYFIDIEIKVDLSTIIQNKGIQPWDTYEVMKIFDKYFVAGGILEKENVKYADGMFILSFNEEHKVGFMVVCEYLIGVLKTCQELELVYCGI